MFCTSCGSPIVDGQSFCTVCGTPIEGTSMSQAPQASPAPSAGYAAAQIPDAAPKRKGLPRLGKTAIASAIVAVCSVVAVAVGVVMTSNPLGGVALADDTGEFVFNVEVVDGAGVAVDAADCGETVSIPIEVEGTTTSGQQVHAQFVYQPGTGPYALPTGGYQVHVLSAPVGSNGSLYTYNGEPYHVEVLQGAHPQGSGQVGNTESAVIERRDDATEQEVADAQQKIDETAQTTDPAIVTRPDEPSGTDGGNGGGASGTAEPSNGGNAGGGASGHGGAPGNGGTSGGDATTPGASPAPAAPQKTEAELRAEERAAAKEAAEKQLEKDKEAALAANQSVYESTNNGTEGPHAQVTGTLAAHKTTDKITGDDVTVYTLELPKKVTITGTQYGDPESDVLIVSGGEKYADHVGETITLEGFYSVRATASIPEAEFSALYCNGSKLVRDYRLRGYVVSAERMGGDYLVVTDYCEFEIPEYWRGKTAYEFTVSEDDYPYVPASCVLAMHVRCTADGQAVKDQDGMYYLMVVPIADYEKGAFTGWESMKASFELTTDAYAVLIAQDDIFNHYGTENDAFVKVMTGGAMDSSESKIDGKSASMPKVSEDFFMEKVLPTFVEKNKKGEMETPKVATPRRDELEQREAESANATGTDAEATHGGLGAVQKNPAELSVDETTPVELTGTIVREEMTTDETMMAWSAVVYWLEFDEPITVTHTSSFGTSTKEVNRITVSQVEQYASGGITDVNVGLEKLHDGTWDAQVGKVVTVRGTLVNTGNAHTMGLCRFKDPTIVE